MTPTVNLTTTAVELVARGLASPSLFGRTQLTDGLKSLTITSTCSMIMHIVCSGD